MWNLLNKFRSQVSLTQVISQILNFMDKKFLHNSTEEIYGVVERLLRMCYQSQAACLFG